MRCLQCGTKTVECRDVPTDFQHFFTLTLCSEAVIKSLLMIPPHLKCVTMLPCEVFGTHSGEQPVFSATLFVVRLYFVILGLSVGHVCRH